MPDDAQITRLIYVVAGFHNGLPKIDHHSLFSVEDAKCKLRNFVL